MYLLEPMNIYAPKGTKVKFMNQHGYDYDRQYAANSLNTEDTYIVDFISVGSFMSYVYLKEVPGKGFNTVMFAEVETNKSSSNLSQDEEDK